MNLRHSPRFAIASIVLLIGLTLIGGVLRAFTPVRAADDLAATPTGRPTVTRAGPPPSTPTPTATPAPPPRPLTANTAGNIGMTSLLVLIILFGVIWGWRKPGKKKETSPGPARPKEGRKRKK